MRRVLLLAAWALGWMAACADEAIDPSDSGHYASVNGLRMYYEIHGAGPALLILHGGMCSIPVWPTAIDYFAKDYRVIAPEQMGHGRTADDMSRPFDYHAMAEDTVELLRQLQVTRVYVLGHSDGGVLALDLAIHHPHLVVKLVAAGTNIDPALPPGSTPPSPESVPAFIREAYQRLSPDGPAHWPILVARVAKMWQHQPHLSDAELKGISAPTLIVAGDRDFVSPEYAVSVWRQIPGAELWIAANSNHSLPRHRAALFNEVVDTFFKEPSPEGR
jgi:pimeloyl-ACP methyl ester carboxylesterase